MQISNNCTTYTTKQCKTNSLVFKFEYEKMTKVNWNGL